IGPGIRQLGPGVSRFCTGSDERVEGAGAVGDESGREQDGAEDGGQPEEKMGTFHCDNSRVGGRGPGANSAMRTKCYTRPLIAVKVGTRRTAGVSRLVATPPAG